MLVGELVLHLPLVFDDFHGEREQIERIAGAFVERRGREG